MLTSSVSFVHLSLVNDLFALRLASAIVVFWWVPQVLWMSPTKILQLTLPWLICLRPSSVRPWLCCGWWTCVGQLVVSVHEGSIIEVVGVSFAGWQQNRQGLETNVLSEEPGVYTLGNLHYLLFCSCIVHDFLKIKIVVRNGVDASSFSHGVPLISGFALGAFWHASSFLRPNISRSWSNLCLWQSALNPHMSFWWIFVEQFESRHTDPGFRQWLVSINIPIIIDGCLVKYINARFRFVSGHQCTSEASENRPSEHRMLFSEQHASEICNPPQCSDIFSSFDFWIWISGFFFSYEEFCEIFSHEVASRFVHSGG